MPADPIWRVASSRTVLADRWINLRADDCVTASGKSIAPYYVLTYPEWVHVVAVTEADELVLVRQYRHAAGAMTLELPGGMMDHDDASAEHAARRELMEETGFAGDRYQPVCALFTNPATHTNRLHIYAAAGVRRVAAPRLEIGEDGLAVQLVPVTEVVARLADGIIGPAMQASAVLLGLAALGRLSFAQPAAPPPPDPPRD